MARWDTFERLTGHWLTEGMSPYQKFVKFGVIDAPLDVALPFIGGFIELQWGGVSVLDGDPAAAKYPDSDSDPIRPTRHASRYNTWGAVVSTPAGSPDKTLVESTLDDIYPMLSEMLSAALTLQFTSIFRFRNTQVEDFVHGFTAWQAGQTIRRIGIEGGNPRAPNNVGITSTGDPLWFEDTAQYTAKRPRERVTRDGVIGCATRCGIDVYRHLLDGDLLRSVRLHPQPAKGLQEKPNPDFGAARAALLTAGFSPNMAEPLAGG